jgi:CheY-like chemotaxis protein
MAEILDEEGHSVVMVSSPQEAIALLGQSAFDLVITDSFASRPGEVAESVADIVTAPGSARILLCTGHPVEIKELTQVGIDAFVRKPFDLDAFTERVSALCTDS